MEENYELFTLMARIDGMSNQFTKTDWKIVQYIKKSTMKFIELSAQELAKEIGTSDASIIRFAQKVGYSGLNELKYTMQKEIDKSSSSVNHSDYSALLNDYKMLLDSLFHLTNPSDINHTRELMLKARRIFIIGLNFNQNTAEIITHKFMTLGLTVQALTNYDTLKLYQSLSQESDLFITLSLSGNHKQLASILADFKKNGSDILLITNYEKSLCSPYASIILLIPKTDLLLSSNIISREILILVLFDLLFHNFLTEDVKSFQSFQKAASYSKLNSDDTRDGLRKFMDLL
ncbi:MurR/RpiR family transcriptional regulator [Clostridium boliviensis]|uniref:MurR/RpiR family transcriptional regulator n=1 Tax=Clostridium boliviensis TaxID=318465 RepID=A0ABU4GJI4_9CLOT|nr:MurR/RpiR family transcriptional regulator [Clostridium boliviensis]MDW2797769.1 MurR/RpiR family transcriptional regulator [Clostridium boliviensis]